MQKTFGRIVSALFAREKDSIRTFLNKQSYFIIWQRFNQKISISLDVMEEKQLIINVFGEVGGDSAININDGKELFKKIDNALSDNLGVILDFGNVHLINTVFLEAMICLLNEKYPKEKLINSIRPDNIRPEFNELFKIVIEQK